MKKIGRLIDAVDTVARMSARIAPLLHSGATPEQIYSEVLQVIAEAPTIDCCGQQCEGGNDG